MQKQVKNYAPEVIFKMKRKSLKMSFMQLFSSPLFYLSIIGVTILCFISIWERVSASETRITVVYCFDIFIGLTMFKKLVVLFAAIPYVSSFCSDWKCQYIKPVVIRTGIKEYIWSKIITCFVSGFLTVFIGLILFIILLSFKMPIFPAENIEQMIFPPFAPLAVGKIPVLYLLAQSFVFSMAAALWAVVGLSLSAFIPINFVAITTPLIASYFLESLTRRLPEWLNIYLLTSSCDVIHQGPFISFAYFVFIFILFSFLPASIFNYQVRRRLRNEVV